MQSLAPWHVAEPKITITVFPTAYSTQGLSSSRHMHHHSDLLSRRRLHHQLLVPSCRHDYPPTASLFQVRVIMSAP